MALLAAVYETGSDGRWHPGIGDPTWMGWLTVAAYFITAWAALRARRASLLVARTSSTAHLERQMARVWLFVSILMLVLGVNKQLDLQTFMTETLRDMARRESWYTQRRPLQVAFILSLAALSIAILALAAVRLRHLGRRIIAPVVGAVVIVGFVLARAASFHHVDNLLSHTGPVRLNWVFELSGIAVLLVSALCQAKSASQPTRLPPRP